MLAWRRLLILAGLLFALSPAAARAASPFEDLAATIATAQAGRPLVVRCHTWADWPSDSLLGYYSGGNAVDLSAGVCSWASLAAERPTVAWGWRYCNGFPLNPAGNCFEWWNVIRAVVALAHETWHAMGVDNEAQTQCYAIQTADLWAAGLGFPHAPYFDVTRSLGFDYMHFLYKAELPALYQSSECRENGALDLTPRDGVWP